MLVNGISLRYAPIPEVTRMLEHSAEIGTIAAALATAQGKFDKIVKDTTNPFFKSKYAPLASIIEGTRKALSENKIAVVQNVEMVDGLCSVTTMLVHESGQWMKGTIAMPIAKLDPQGVGSASTYARRYGLSSFINVAADDDDDGNEATKKVQEVAAKLPDADITRYSGMLENSDSLDMLKVAFKEAVNAATKIGDIQSLTAFTAIKERQKKKLEAKLPKNHSEDLRPGERPEVVNARG